VGTGLTTAQYTITAPRDFPAASAMKWVGRIFSTSTGIASYANNWSVNWNALTEGQHFVSVRAYDGVGLSSTSLDVFYIKKDTSGPQSLICKAATPPGGVHPATLYNVDFADAGSQLNEIQYSIRTSSNGAGTLLKDWTHIAAPPLNQASYTTTGR